MVDSQLAENFFELTVKGSLSQVASASQKKRRRECTLPERRPGASSRRVARSCELRPCDRAIKHNCQPRVVQQSLKRTNGSGHAMRPPKSSCSRIEGVRPTGRARKTGTRASRGPDGGQKEPTVKARGGAEKHAIQTKDRQTLLQRKRVTRVSI